MRPPLFFCGLLAKFVRETHSWSDVMFRFLCAMAAFSVVAVSPALAASDPATPSKPAKEKKVCKSDNRTGSIMPKRICRTQEEWDRLTEQGRADMDRVRDMDRSRAMTSPSR
jgi:hypothetical protein